MDALQKAQQDHVVLGLEGVSGLQPRLDIDVLLSTKPDTFNLFVLALHQLQDPTNTKDPMSYYQIAGIHGLPSTYWDGIEVDAKRDKYGGYCPHGRVTFPTWHRSYIALYEQSIYSKMAEIAEQYPETIDGKPVRARYRAALKEFRLPYWDYYRPREQRSTTFPGVTAGNGKTIFPYDYYLPKIFTTPSITVRQTSDDKLVTLKDNPLYRYQFPDGTQGGFGADDWASAQASDVYCRTYTVRHPRTRTDDVGDAKDMNDRLNARRMDNNRQIRDMVIGKAGYESFASTAATPGPSGNLEGLHNQYHVLLGGSINTPQEVSGWMSVIATAAFDPVFWIHHCNIDRYAAIWQAAHPGSWVTSKGAKTDLAGNNVPFRKSRGATSKDDVYWLGNDQQNSRLYGSYYEDAYDPQQQRLKTGDDVKKNFVNLYGWSIPNSGPAAQVPAPPDSMKPLDLTHAQVFSPPDGLPAGPGPVLGHAPQVVMKKVTHAATAAVTTAAATVSAAVGTTLPIAQFAIVPDQSLKQIDTHPVAPGASTSTKAFTNVSKDATDVAPPNVDESKYHRDWYIDDIVERLAFNGPFSVYYFIGDFVDDVSQYPKQPTLAGQTYIFTSSRELCDNCGQLGDERALVTDTSPITSMLLDYVGRGLTDLTPASVVPFLVQNLKWRIVTATGERKDPRNTPGFKVGISSKLSPVDGDGISGFLYQEFPQVIDQIIARAG